MRLIIVSIVSCFCLLLGCSDRQDKEGYVTYTTSSDSTLYYYQKGWQQIMDEGRYGASEVSYRKALEFDPDFLIGKSVLARLTRDLNERLALYGVLEKRKDEISGDERLILDVYTALTHFTNIREQDPETAKNLLTEVYDIAKSNLEVIATKYPNEIYLKCEYIEFIHATKGAEEALQVLEKLTTKKQRDNHFMLGYKAHMLAELGQYKTALTSAERLDLLVTDPTCPKPYAVYADVYYQMDSIELAAGYVESAFLLDSFNLDASRLRNKILEEMKSNEVLE